MFKFTPVKEKDLIDSLNLKEGEHNFEVMVSEHAVSKKGDEMCKLTLNVSGHRVSDYLVFSKNPFLLHKILKFCQSTGIEDQYNAGSIDSNLCGLTGRCVIKIEKGEENGRGGFHNDRPVVRGYLPRNESVENAEGSFDDDIPF